MKPKSYEQLKKSVQGHTIVAIFLLIALAWVGLSYISYAQDHKTTNLDNELLQLQNKMLIYALKQETKQVMFEQKKFKEAACLPRIKKFDKIFCVKGL